MEICFCKIYIDVEDALISNVLPLILDRDKAGFTCYNIREQMNTALGSGSGSALPECDVG